MDQKPKEQFSGCVFRPEIRRICSRIARAQRDIADLRQATSALKDDYSVLERDIDKLSPQIKSMSTETSHIVNERKVDNYFSTIIGELENYGKRVKLGVFYTRDLRSFCHPGKKVGSDMTSQSLTMNVSGLNDTLEILSRNEVDH